MISEIYDAFLAAGAPEDKARKAAETVADWRLSRFDGAILQIESQLVALKWMTGFAIALDVAILTRLFVH